ncbi:MAG: hypothetical protein M0Q88_09350 [Bacilli bacterium]|nr:hypothetical protein [Bacilli bacterium]
MAKEDTFGCCSSHLECQLTGKCESKVSDYNKCMLYRYVIRHKFPILYKLKQAGYIEIENNHITTEGIEVLKEKIKNPDRLFILLFIVYLLGQKDIGRIHPTNIYSEFVKTIKVLNI